MPLCVVLTAAATVGLDAVAGLLAVFARDAVEDFFAAFLLVLAAAAAGSMKLTSV